MACWPRPSWNSSSPYVAHKRFVYRPSSQHKGRSARSRSPDINPLTSLPPPGIIRVAGRGLTPQGPPCLLLFTPFSREGNQCNGNAAQLQELTQILPCNNAASYSYEQFRLRPVPRPSYADGTTCFPPRQRIAPLLRHRMSQCAKAGQLRRCHTFQIQKTSPQLRRVCHPERRAQVSHPQKLAQPPC